SHSIISIICFIFFLFFITHTAHTQTYTLSLHDALPISTRWQRTSLLVSRVLNAIRSNAPRRLPGSTQTSRSFPKASTRSLVNGRSEEHTSELQSPCNLVCRLLLEKKKENILPHLLIFCT